MKFENEDPRPQSQQLSSIRPSQTEAARRFQRSRERLGFRRHELLVAMRVVNSIEREMLQAEWENFVIEEDVKCKRLGAMLRQNTTELLTRKQQRVSVSDPRRLEEIRAWQQQYCESCHNELETIVIQVRKFEQPGD